MTKNTPTLARRDVLKALSLVPVSYAATTPFWASQAAAEVGLIATNVCLVSPETTEGPYYIDPELIRTDITEGKLGAALTLTLQVVSSECAPLMGARVDAWHCDAEGNYSGFAGQGSDTALGTAGQTFLRGTQFTDMNGIAKFDTIYPGWYQGRTTHIHFMIYINDVTILTSQIFFPDEMNAAVFASMPPYNARSGSPETTNGNDGIAQDAGAGAIAAVTTDGRGYAASLVVGIQA